MRGRKCKRRRRIGGELFFRGDRRGGRGSFVAVSGHAKMGEKDRGKEIFEGGRGES